MVIVLSSLFNNMVNNFLISFGVVVGASIFGGIGAVLTNDPPLKAMLDIASSIKIWAVAVTLGGTFSSFAAIEKGLFEGEFKSILKQAIYVLSALLGANTGYNAIKLIQRCSE